MYANDVARSLPPLIAQSLLRAISEFDSGYIAESLRQKVRNREDTSDAAERDRRDRLATSIRIFGLNYSQDMRAPEEVSGEQLPEIVRRAESLWETKIIRADSRHLLPTWDRVDSDDSWFLFTKGRRRLFLLEAHADIEESTLGGDLVYLRKNPDSLVVVQYKRAVMGTTMTEARCPVDDRFTAQIRKMQALVESSKAHRASSGIDYRLSAMAGYIKLIEDRPRVREPGHVYQGYYFPVDYFSQLLQEAKGPLKISLEDDRYLDSQTFIRLAADGWIGSSGVDTRHLVDQIKASHMLEFDEDLTIAIETPG